MSDPKRPFYRNPWIIGIVIFVACGIVSLTMVVPVIAAMVLYFTLPQTTASVPTIPAPTAISTQAPSIAPSVTPTAVPTPTATFQPPAVDQSYVLGSGVITRISLSPDGKLYAIGTMQETLIVDSTSMQELCRFEHQGPNKQINGMAWSPDSSRLAIEYFYSFDDGARAVVWNIAQRQEEQTLLGQPHSSGFLAWSPDGKQLASISNNSTGRVVVWDVDSGSILYGPIENSSEFIIWSDDGGLLLYSRPDGKIAVLDAKTFEVLRTQDGNSISISSRYHWVASTRVTKSASQVIIWDPATGQVIHVIDGLKFPPQPKDIATWSPDGTKLIIAEDSKPPIIVGTDGTKFTQSQLDTTAINVTNAVWSADSQQIATWGWYRGRTLDIWSAEGVHRKGFDLPANFSLSGLEWAPDNSAVITTNGQLSPALIWNINTGEHTQFAPDYIGAQSVAVWSPDGQVLASGWREGPIMLWNLTTRTADKSVELSSSGAMALAFSPDGSRLAAHGTDNSVSILDAQTGQELRRMEGDNVQIPYEHTLFEGLAWSADGRLLAAGFAKHLIIWDSATGERRIVIPTPDAYYPDELSFSPDGTQLVYRSWNRLMVVSVQTGERIRTFDGILGASWTSSEDLRLLSQAGDQAITWDSASDLPIPGTTPLPGKLSAGAFSPDGKYFAEVRAVTNEDSQMIVWNMADGTSISSVPFSGGFQSPHVAWSTDSTQVAIPSFDGRIVVLRVN